MSQTAPAIQDLMFGRFELADGRSIIGTLRTCNVQPNGTYSGPFTDVTITRLSGRWVRLPAATIVGFSPR